MNKCSIDGCDGEMLAKGLCNKHYKRMAIYGDPLFMKNRSSGEGTPYPSGYCKISINKRRKLRHVLVAEKVIGKELPNGAVVHHVDEKRSNDINSNLVICQSRAYHRLLHQRTRALHECGNASWKLCRFCKEHNPIEEMAGKWWHRDCLNKSRREREATHVRI